MREDAGLGKVIAEKEWLLDICKIKNSDAIEQLKRIRADRKAVREVRGFLSKWTGKIDSKSMAVTWPILKGTLAKDIDKDELQLLLNEMDARLRKQGWVPAMVEPNVQNVLEKFLKRLVESKSRMSFSERKLRSAGAGGTAAEYNQVQEYRKLKSEAEQCEIKCVHLLLANLQFLAKLRSGKIKLSNPLLTRELAGLLKKTNPKLINDRIWLKAMREKFEQD